MSEVIFTIKAKAIFISSLFLLLSLSAFINNALSATYYMSPDGSSSNNGSINSPWSDLNYVLNKFSNNGTDARIKPGDTLYLRGGVYNVASMTKPSGYSGPVMALNTNTNSAMITIKSYPGEWAILDGGRTSQILVAYQNTPTYNITFADMEIRNGSGVEGCGFVFGDGWSGVRIFKSIFRNLYFHDNNYSDYNQNPAGLHLSGDSCIVEYCTFENNGTPGSSHHNSANLILYNSYNGSNNGSALGSIDVSPRKNNIIRYNKFIGSAASIKDKGEGNFVDMRPGHNPLTERHPEWYNEIHHNVITGAADSGYYLHQDFVKVHHNLFDNCRKGVYYDGNQSGTIPLIWEAQIYNNTFVSSGGSDIQIDESKLSNSSYGGYNFGIYNNLSINPKLDMLSFFSGGWVSSPPTWAMTENHNGIDSSTNKPVGYYKGVPQNLAQWQALGFGTSTIYTSFSLNSDFSLTASSAARSAGRSGVDLGAFPYETTNWYNQAGYNKSSTTLPLATPAAPANLVIVSAS